jgi:hypothetical protein
MFKLPALANLTWLEGSVGKKSPLKYCRSYLIKGGFIMLKIIIIICRCTLIEPFGR